jgi:hypothetical protein
MLPAPAAAETSNQQDHLKNEKNLKYIQTFNLEVLRLFGSIKKVNIHRYKVNGRVYNNRSKNLSVSTAVSTVLSGNDKSSSSSNKNGDNDDIDDCDDEGENKDIFIYIYIYIYI